VGLRLSENTQEQQTQVLMENDGRDKRKEKRGSNKHGGRRRNINEIKRKQCKEDEIR
jgi:hypothetical protein